MIFVDTSVWFAANVSEDLEHNAARQALLASPEDLVTTDYVVDELLTLLVARGHREVAARVGQNILTGGACDVIWTSQSDILDAFSVFVRFQDKNWSFTDCVSYLVMKRLGIREALSLDDHFRQFGFASVLP